jgi:predicted nucleic acid-binding Zn ribbon protein
VADNGHVKRRELMSILYIIGAVVVIVVVLRLLGLF